ncbi:uncharacterized protein LOC129607976 [Condylostylus longicornis]|uniref:uncharacterized protein LOC129607976 n=1 Tax=Condylostylus longicornis TaxID=2530218 RepID=UPI00244DB178|nr:uncharacterized protein LOC129607976 [Condylostylus longicornis]
MAVREEQCFGTYCDGEFEICTITTENIEEALDVLHRSFFVKESVVIGSEINLPENEQARQELRLLSKIVGQDGVSLMARHRPTKKIVSVAFNKIQYVDDTVQEVFFEVFKNKYCSSPNSISLLNYMISMDEKINVFDIYNIDCVLEIMFLATLPEFEKRGLGKILCEYSIELVKNINKGIGIDKLHPNLKDKIPKGLCSLLTSKFSQKIGDKLGFKTLNRVPFSEYKFNGKSFADRIGPQHPDSTQSFLHINDC